MTQHFIKTTHLNEPVEVLLGWDKPLQRFFLVIEKIDIEYEAEDFEDGDEYVYSNILDKNLPVDSIHYQDLGYFKRVLEGLNISVPENLWEDLLNDKKLNIGNAMTRWNLDGTKK